MKDTTAEWWTVPKTTNDKDEFQLLRESLPFENMVCHNKGGGFVIYFDRPRKAYNPNLELVSLRAELAALREALRAALSELEHLTASIETCDLQESTDEAMAKARAALARSGKGEA